MKFIFRKIKEVLLIGLAAILALVNFYVPNKALAGHNCQSYTTTPATVLANQSVSITVNQAGQLVDGDETLQTTTGLTFTPGTSNPTQITATRAGGLPAGTYTIQIVEGDLHTANCATPLVVTGASTPAPGSPVDDGAGAPSGQVLQPGVLSASPKEIIAGSGDIPVKIQGYNYSSFEKLDINANGADFPATVNNNTEITAVLPARLFASPGNVVLGVTGTLAGTRIPSSDTITLKVVERQRPKLEEKVELVGVGKSSLDTIVRRNGTFGAQAENGITDIEILSLHLDDKTALPTSILNLSAVPGTNGVGGLVRSGDSAVSFSLTEAASTFSNDGLALTANFKNGQWVGLDLNKFNLNSFSLSGGQYLLTYSVTDMAGDVSQTSRVDGVRVRAKDNTPPVIDIVIPPFSPPPVKESPEVEVTVSDLNDKGEPDKLTNTDFIVIGESVVGSSAGNESGACLGFFCNAGETAQQLFGVKNLSPLTLLFNITGWVDVFRGTSMGTTFAGPVNPGGAPIVIPSSESGVEEFLIKVSPKKPDDSWLALSLFHDPLQVRNDRLKGTALEGSIKAGQVLAPVTFMNYTGPDLMLAIEKNDQVIIGPTDLGANVNRSGSVSIGGITTFPSDPLTLYSFRLMEKASGRIVAAVSFRTQGDEVLRDTVSYAYNYELPPCEGRKYFLDRAASQWGNVYYPTRCEPVDTGAFYMTATMVDGALVYIHSDDLPTESEMYPKFDGNVVAIGVTAVDAFGNRSSKLLRLGERPPIEFEVVSEETPPVFIGIAPLREELPPFSVSVSESDQSFAELSRLTQPVFIGLAPGLSIPIIPPFIGIAPLEYAGISEEETAPIDIFLTPRSQVSPVEIRLAPKPAASDDVIVDVTLLEDDATLDDVVIDFTVVPEADTTPPEAPEGLSPTPNTETGDIDIEFKPESQPSSEAPSKKVPAAAGATAVGGEAPQPKTINELFQGWISGIFGLNSSPSSKYFPDGHDARFSESTFERWLEAGHGSQDSQLKMEEGHSVYVSNLKGWGE